MKKTALFLVFAMILVMLISCKDGADVKGNDRVITIAKDGKCEYVIVYPQQFRDAERDVASYIKKVIEHYSGAKVKIMTDRVTDETKEDPDAKEILVGNTNRKESEQANSPITAKVIENKIVIKGIDVNGIYYAAGAFVSQYIKKSVDGIITVPSDMSIEERIDTVEGWMLYAMPVMEGVDIANNGKFFTTRVTNAYDSRGNFANKEYVCVQYITGVELSLLDAYVEKLEQYGYVVDSRTSYEDRHVVSIYRACAGRNHRYCLTLNGSKLTISQIVPFK